MKQGRGPAWVVLCLFAASIFAVGCPYRRPKPEDASFTDAERWLFHVLFKMRVSRRPDGATSAGLTAGYMPCGGCPGGSDAYVFSQYMLTLATAHHDLLKDDATYARRFSEFEADVISRLGLRSSFAEGSRVVYAEGVRRRIFDAILARAVRSPIAHVPPPFSEYDENGARETPFASGVDLFGSPSDAQASVRPFHYCSGTGGITISGGDVDPYVRAHNRLRRHDREYAKRFNEVVVPLVERAEKADRFDFETTAKITDDLRRALVEAGIAERIERRVEKEAAKDETEAGASGVRAN